MNYFVVCQAELTLREGSGYFFVNTSVQGIANVEFQESQGTAEVGLSSARGRDDANAADFKQLGFICFRSSKLL